MDYSHGAQAALDALAGIEVRATTKALVLLPPGPAGVGLAAQLAQETGGVSLGGCMEVAIEGESIAARKPAYGGRAVAGLRTSRWPFA